MRRIAGVVALVVWVPLSGYVGSQGWDRFTRIFWDFSPAANLVFALGSVWAALLAFRVGQRVRQRRGMHLTCAAAAGAAIGANLLVYSLTIGIAFRVPAAALIYTPLMAILHGYAGLILGAIVLAGAVWIADRRGWLEQDPIQDVLSGDPG